jgi:hypothetical protein
VIPEESWFKLWHTGGRKKHWWLLIAGTSLLALFVPRARLELGCATIWRCYQSPAFNLTVIDAESGQPVIFVHAIAEWVQYGYHGAGPPLVTIDAVSGPDGIISFPSWGPIPGSRGGLHHNEDPIISLFKPGYNALVLWNDSFPGDAEYTGRRWASHDGRTIPLEPFHGSRLAWYGQLDKAQRGYASGGHAAKILQTENPYVNRLQRVLTEVRQLPKYRVSERTVSLDDHFRVEDSIKFYQEHSR